MNLPPDKSLLIYPHGLGDIIMMTPMLRYLHEQLFYGQIRVALLGRFDGSEILDNCPWIEDVHYCLPDPWNGSTRDLCRKHGEKLATDNGYNPVWIWHPQGMNKIDWMCSGMPSGEPLGTHVFIDERHIVQARDWLRERGLIMRGRSEVTQTISFFHGSTGMPGLSTAAAKKDISFDWAMANLPRRNDIIAVVDEPLDPGDRMGVHFLEKTKMPIQTQFEIMRQCSHVCLADSVFFHAAAAMNQTVDMVFFGRGEEVYRRVRPLHHHEHRVVYDLEGVQP